MLEPGIVFSILNHEPIEVIRVEMQSQIKTPGRPEKLTIATAAKWIYKSNGFKGFYRGVTPRIGLGIWQTVRFCAETHAFRFVWSLVVIR